LILGFSTALAAQDAPQWEIFGGYSYYLAGGRTNTHGIHISAARNVTDYFGVVSEFSAHFGDEVVVLTPVPPGGMKVNGKELLALFGPRITFRKFKRVDLFTHYLIGLAYARDNQVPVRPTVSDTTWAYGVGFGVDLKSRKRLSIRLIQGDWITTHFPQANQEAQDNWRISTGLVLRLGH